MNTTADDFAQLDDGGEFETTERQQLASDMRGQLTTASDVVTFALAGNALSRWAYEFPRPKRRDAIKSKQCSAHSAALSVRDELRTLMRQLTTGTCNDTRSDDSCSAKAV